MKRTFDNIGAVGFNGDLPAHDLPEDPLAWSSITNMGFRGGLAERVQGYAAGFDLTPTEAHYGLFSSTQADGTKYVIGCADNKVYSYNNTTERDITASVTVAATADTKWSGGIISGLLVLNETANAPTFIAVSALGSGGLAALTNWPDSTLCKTLRPFKYFLVAGYMTESSTAYPYKVRWSTSAVPGALPASWLAATDNDAGSVDLSADDGVIVDMVPFGDQLAIYRNGGSAGGGITMMRYTGGSEVMVFNRVPSASGGGIIGLNCVADVPGVGHVVLSASDLYVFNGTTIKSVLDKRIRRWMQNNISTTNGKRSFVVHHARNNEVWACFPESGEGACTKAIIWNYYEDSLGVRDLPNATAGIHDEISEQTPITFDAISGTFATVTSTFNSVDPSSTASKTVLSSTDNKLYVIGNGTDKAGSALIGQLERTGISLGDGQRLKYVRGLWPRIDATVGQQIEVTVGMQMSVDEAVTWGSPTIYTVGTSRFVPVNRAGRYVALRLRSPSGEAWRMKSFDMDFEPKGLW
jgi:hypothetical protein